MRKRRRKWSRQREKGEVNRVTQEWGKGDAESERGKWCEDDEEEHVSEQKK